MIILGVILLVGGFVASNVVDGRGTRLPAVSHPVEVPARDGYQHGR